MSRLSRLLVLLGALSMSLLFLFPMWKIYLKAPQYPEGLEMHIWVNKISGNTEYTLQNFNILNHYIGMRPIEESSFAELEFMPYIAWALMLLGIVVVVVKNKYLLASWLGLLVIAGTAGLIDFYLWLVDFGTNLSPHAPIKIPGMTYIPPFIGPKQLLNFDALSLPAAGSLGLAIPMLFAAFAVYREFFARKKSFRSKHVVAAIPLLLSIGLLSCSVEPQPIAYGQVDCVHCKMTLSDARYGSELVTSKGKAYFFDSIECLAAYLHEHADMKEKAEFLLVTDFQQPGELLKAEEAVYLQSAALPSPMGMYLTATKDEAAANKLKQTYDGRLLSWDEVQKAVRTNERPN